MVSVTFKKEEDYAEVMQNTNPVIAAYTTAIARLKLNEYIQQLGDRVLYFDTDSIIYRTDLTDPTHQLIPTGTSLGEMTNELSDYGPDAYISEFVSGGPKNYGYKVSGTRDGKDVTCMKVRGITLTNTASKTVNIKILKQMVYDLAKKDRITTFDIVSRRINVNRKNRQIVTKTVSKKFRIVYDKRIIGPNFTTFPYGYQFY